MKRKRVVSFGVPASTTLRPRKVGAPLPSFVRFICSVIGSELHVTFRWEDRAAGRIVQTITGAAFITAEATLI